MARLSRGENPKIDKVNDLVELAQMNIGEQSSESITTLLDMFKPLMLSLCGKWSKYFNDEKHNIIQFKELYADAQYWFVYYTIYKYTIDGEATFNTFIKNHLDQRIRYIYERELKYYSKLIFPDPDKRSDNEDIDTFELVISNYSSHNDYNLEDSVIGDDDRDNREELAHKIISLVKSGNFNDREKEIFIEIICNGVTHEEMGKRLNVSRTRITQILRKVKAKLYKSMNNNEEIWSLVIKTDIDFKEQ